MVRNAYSAGLQPQPLQPGESSQPSWLLLLECPEGVYSTTLTDKWEDEIDIIDPMTLGAVHRAISSPIVLSPPSEVLPSLPSLDSLLRPHDDEAVKAQPRGIGQQSSSSFTAELSRPVTVRCQNSKPGPCRGDSFEAEDDMDRQAQPEVKRSKSARLSSSNFKTERTPSCSFPSAKVDSLKNLHHETRSAELTKRPADISSASIVREEEPMQIFEEEQSPNIGKANSNFVSDTSQSSFIPLVRILQEWHNPSFGFAPIAPRAQKLLAVSTTTSLRRPAQSVMCSHCWLLARSFADLCLEQLPDDYNAVQVPTAVSKEQLLKANVMQQIDNKFLLTRSNSIILVGTFKLLPWQSMRFNMAMM